jgi:hypothetical protein
MDASDAERGPAWRGRAAAVLASVVFGALVLRSNFLIDDAFISFRYARVWAETGVPAYNAGAAQPVEGYSNFLWVAVLRAAYGAGLPLTSTARVLSVGCGLATLLLTLHILRTRCRAGALAAGLGALALATSPPFTVWCTGGLETASLALLLLSTFAVLTAPAGAHERRRGALAGALAVALALTRVEGFIWVLGIALCAWLANALSPAGARRRAPRFVPYFALYLVGFGGFLLWRHAVYGAWIANTAHAKAGLSTAVLGRGLATTAMYFLLGVLPLVALAGVPLAARGERRGIALGAAGLYAGGLLYNVFVGGDWMPFFRFLAPLAPFVALLFGLLFVGRGRALALGVGAPLLVLQVLPVYDVHVAPRAWREALDFRHFQTGYQTERERWALGNDNLDNFRRIGRGLRAVSQPGDSITMGAIGGVGWESGLVVYDRNGLVDREVASLPPNTTRSAGHDKRVPRAFFIERKPTYFQAMLVPAALPAGVLPPRHPILAPLVQKVFVQDPDEEALRGVCLPHALPLPPDDEFPEGSTLLVLRWTDDEQAARQFWAAALRD